MLWPIASLPQPDMWIKTFNGSGVEQGRFQSSQLIGLSTSGTGSTWVVTTQMKAGGLPSGQTLIPGIFTSQSDALVAIDAYLAALNVQP